MWIADSFASDLAHGGFRVFLKRKKRNGHPDDGNSDAVVRSLGFLLIDHRTAPFQKFAPT